MKGSRHILPLLLLMLFGLSSLQASVQSWTNVDGQTVEAELVDYEWGSQQLTLQPVTGQPPSRVYVEQLDFPSKLLLLASPAYWEAFEANREEIEAQPNYQTRLSELKTIVLVLCITYVMTLLSVSWVLASWIMRQGSILPLIKIILLYGFITTSVVFVLKQFGGGLDLLGEHRTYFLAGIGCYFLFFVALAMWIFKTGFFRALTWYVVTAIAVVALPLTLATTGVVSQIYKTQGEVSMESAEAYFMETWFEPMGLL